MRSALEIGGPAPHGVGLQKMRGNVLSELLPAELLTGAGVVVGASVVEVARAVVLVVVVVVHVARGSIVFPFDFTGLAEQYRLVGKARRFTVQIITSSPE